MPSPSGQEMSACSFCGSRSFPEHAEINGYRVVRCDQCGLWMVNPLPSAEFLADFYNQAYYANPQWICSVDQDTVMRISAGKLPAFRETCSRIKRVRPADRLLDVGCAFGQFMAVAEGQGFDTTGVELDMLVAARARSFGLNVVTGDFLGVDLPTRYYDVVTMWYVLEHVRDPIATLTRAGELLRDDGILFVRVPNMAFGLPFLRMSRLGLRRLPSILSHVPAHLHFYTVQVLRRLVGSVGFQIVSVEHGQPIYSYGSKFAPRAKNASRRVISHLANSLAALTGQRWYCGPSLSLYARKIRS